MNGATSCEVEQVAGECPVIVGVGEVDVEAAGQVELGVVGQQPPH